MKALLKVILMGVSAVVLILDSQTACAAGVEGIQLCIRVVIPSLFPFLFLSTVIGSSLGSFRFRFLGPIARLCRLPKDCGPLLAIGLLGGYPTGAQAVSTAHEKGCLPDDAARRLLVVCNNCGPAFLFGMVSRSFSSIASAWKIWLITLIASLITGLLLPGKGGHIRFQNNMKTESPAMLMDQSLRTMARICGWVTLFRVVLTVADRWILWMLPGWVRVTICGLTELTNGAISLSQIPEENLRFILSCAMLSFGGLCVSMQTLSVIHPGLDCRLYFPGKVLHSCISALLAWIFNPIGWGLPVIVTTIGGFTMLFLRKSVKRSRFSQKIGV